MMNMEKGFVPGGYVRRDAKMKSSTAWTAILDKYREMKLDRPDLDSFSDIYSAEEISRDKMFLQTLKAKEVDGPVQGKILENILVEQAELSNWLGEGSYVIPLTEYDDRVTRGDAVLEFEDVNGDTIRIILDITISSHGENLAKKVSKGSTKIDKLSEVKYFQSELNGFRGKITNIPLVTVGVDGDSLKRLCEDFSISKKQEGNMVQFMLLDEIQSQLTYMLATSEEINGENSGITKKLAKTLDAINDIAEKKQSLRTESMEAEIATDKTYSILMGFSA